MKVQILSSCQTLHVHVQYLPQNTSSCSIYPIPSYKHQQCSLLWCI